MCTWYKPSTCIVFKQKVIRWKVAAAWCWLLRGVGTSVFLFVCQTCRRRGIYKFRPEHANIFPSAPDSCLFSESKAEETKKLLQNDRPGAVAVGSALTFSLVGSPGCAGEGQEGTLLPRPLRSHGGNSWAVGWEGTGCTGLPLGQKTHSKAKHIVCRLIHASLSRAHACTWTFARLHRGIS